MGVGSLLNQEVTLYNKSSYDGYGRAVQGEGTGEMARIQPKQKRVRDGKGDTLVIEAVAYFMRDVTIAEDDQVDYDGNSYRVLNVYKTPGARGRTEFVRAELVKWQT